MLLNQRMTTALMAAALIGLAGPGCKDTAPSNPQPDASNVDVDGGAADGGDGSSLDTDATDPPDTVTDTADILSDEGKDAPLETGGELPDVSDPDAADTADEGPDIPPPNACLPAGTGPTFQVSARGNLRWKRAMALEQDALGALELTVAEACGEVGYDGICFNLLHLVPLGGNEPVIATMYEPLAAPAATTAIAVDRVIVAACGAAVDRDTLLTVGTPDKPPTDDAKAVVFVDLDLSLKEVDAQTKGVKEVITDLYRRFLARNPSAEEMNLALTLTEAVDGTSPNARDFAKMACFAVATTTENIFQ